MKDSQCELCDRVDVETTIHHLTPKEMGGTLLPTAQLCRPCHKQIHALYTNSDLVERELTSLPALQQDPAIASFLRWIRKQPSSSLPKLRKSQRVRGN
ncbi:HNH endonuclease signature motif containing protein [Paenibacillus roseipurpureus]|uniref:HNH endonuclease signature motif containing protein n=1 Tax=Paenibacillus roseopurpureus TaxID=2918901 RepID=A0AA96RJ14_9BACL|nr:HNH endonuclease signature motif containing protein [Paenibacillus sp. MBLB1832]WNR44898.1 HNH endonuclease signature motif containing protein [Paenibacillus sp. MBLB1832]